MQTIYYVNIRRAKSALSLTPVMQLQELRLPPVMQLHLEHILPYAHRDNLSLPLLQIAGRP